MSADGEAEALAQIGNILDTFIEGKIPHLTALSRISTVMSESGAWE